MRRYRRCFSHFFFFSGSVKSSLRHQGESYTHGYLLLIIISVGVPRCVAIVSIPAVVVDLFLSHSRHTYVFQIKQWPPLSNHKLDDDRVSFSFFPPPPFFQVDSQQNVILIAPKRDLSLFYSVIFSSFFFLFSILRLLLLRCEEFRDDGTRIGIPSLSTTKKLRKWSYVELKVAIKQQGNLPDRENVVVIVLSLSAHNRCGVYRFVMDI